MPREAGRAGTPNEIAIRRVRRFPPRYRRLRGPGAGAYLAGVRLRTMRKQGTRSGVVRHWACNVAGSVKRSRNSNARPPPEHNEQAWSMRHRLRQAISPGMMGCTKSIGPGATNLVTAARRACETGCRCCSPANVRSRAPDPVLQQSRGFRGGKSRQRLIRTVCRASSIARASGQFFRVSARVSADDPALCGRSRCTGAGCADDGMGLDG